MAPTVRRARRAAIRRSGELRGGLSSHGRGAISAGRGMRAAGLAGSVERVLKRLRVPLEALLLCALLGGGIAEALGDDTLTASGRAVGVAGATAAVIALAFSRRAPEASFGALFAIVAAWV